MRILILALVAYIAALLSFWRWPRTRDVEDDEATDPLTDDREDRDGDLSARLSEAAISFGRAAKDIADRADRLKTAVADLSGRCADLSGRAAGDEDFARRNRVAILRLLFPLYEVVRRIVPMARLEATPERDALLEDAAALIAGSGDALGAIAERADETALRHLEADLDILRERLPDDRPRP